MTESEVVALIEKAEREGWTELDLRGAYLYTLPPAIGRLYQLEVLKLGYNQETRRFNYLTTLPDELRNLNNLQTLDLRSNKLSALPEWLGQLSNLQTLDLRGLNLSALPEWLGQLSNLQTLDLRGLNLSALPEWLGQLSNLKSLDLRGLKLSALPEWLGGLSNLQSLYLNALNLSTLPEWLVRLSSLQSLGLGVNKLRELPEWLGEMRNLQTLDLSFNDFRVLPVWLGQLSDLKSLDLSFNFLNVLPVWMGQLHNLQSFNISSNDLNVLHAWLGQLSNLQSLNLSNNNLNTLPEWVGQLSNLQLLNISLNNLSTLPEWVGRLRNLQTLDIGVNCLNVLPEWLGRLRNLQSLNLQGLNLSTLPEWLSELSDLRSLNLSLNKISELPKWLGELSNLQSLDLNRNKLSVLPEWLSELSNLQLLALGFNNFNVLPEWLGTLRNLQTLDLSELNLNALPEWLGQLSNLQTLNLSLNNLSMLPEWLGQLSNLQKLDLSLNNLSMLPEWLGQLHNLKVLYLYNNSITEPSPEVIGKTLTEPLSSVDMTALQRYYAQLREVGTDVFYEAKLLIIGEGGAGKTSLACKLKNPAAELSLTEESTEGIDISVWRFLLPLDRDQDYFNVNIWDFGGQKDYLAPHQFFLTKHSVYVLVTDTRNQNTDFYTWLKMQETLGGSSPVILLKNRNREKGNRFTIENLSQLRERFPNLKSVFELDLNNVPKEASWAELLRELKFRFMGLEHVGKPRPRTWVDVRKALDVDERDTVTREQFLELCYAQGVRREGDALQLSDYLHHLGDILHFQDDPVLNDIVILNPTWGLDAVYRVFDNPQILDNSGKFTLADLHELWHEPRYIGHQHQLLRLMQNFQLCYPLPEKPDTFISPQLLKDDVLDYEWGDTDNLQLRYRYPVFMPRGLLSRAIVKLHERIENQTLVWKSGVILCDRYARAELLEIRGESEIRLRISGRLKRELLMEIVRALDDLHRGFPKLRYDKLIPCKCDTCIESAEPHFFKLDKLLERLAYKKELVDCDNPPFAKVAIRDLLDDGIIQTQIDPLDRDTVYNIFGDMIKVGDVRGSSGLSVGRGAEARVVKPGE